MGKHSHDAIIDKNSKEMIFGDSRQNDLAKWIQKQNCDRLILSHETFYALKNARFPFVKSSNERNDESYAALVAYKEKQGNLLILQLHKQLGGTVKNLRVAYKAHQKGEKSSLTSECIQKLDDMDSWIARIELHVRLRASVASTKSIKIPGECVKEINTEA